MTPDAPPLEPIAHNQIVAFAQLGYKRIKFAEVIAVVRVAQHNVFPGRIDDAMRESGTIAANRDTNDARAVLLRNFDRSIGAAVIGDHDFAANPAPL